MKEIIYEYKVTSLPTVGIPNSRYYLLLDSEDDSVEEYVTDKLGKFYQVGKTVDLSGYVPITRTISINGEVYDLSQDRSWTIDIPLTDWDSITGKPTEFTPTAHTHIWDEILDKPTFSTVATTGSYNDLLDKPTIAADWSTLTGKPNSGEFIHNQFTSAQTANAWISGNFRASASIAHVNGTGSVALSSASGNAILDLTGNTQALIRYGSSDRIAFDANWIILRNKPVLIQGVKVIVEDKLTVGYGYASAPTTYQFDVNGTGRFVNNLYLSGDILQSANKVIHNTSYPLYLRGTSASNTSIIVGDNGGKIGLGTAIPNAHAHVAKNTTTYTNILEASSQQAGTQFLVNDTISGTIYSVNDVSGLPIIEANSNWDVYMYDYPTVVFKKQGTKITVNKLNITSVTTYADDTAAGAGGLTTGDIYKTSTGQLMIKL